ncbi:unnamed protein product [Lepeophtheirus salmonis]|uniref:(salmon louse) hypothetical protein n=1 Tax=Lepeophtheirus salmonis TaxID=72036 RepID=A0A7R8CLN3_LEPSM|nr:unnamed protein product [Lepeophtheirus salmonis]CAF2853990.1 unnamed protein product [Lepeophtheirus salmonis]
MNTQVLLLLLVSQYSYGKPLDGKILGLINIQMNAKAWEDLLMETVLLGFGVCCVLRVRECGGRINKNCTYLQNPGFSSSFSQTTGPCQFNFESPSINGDNNICRIRLDFKTFEIQDPTSTGDCGNERLDIVSSTGSLIPTFCGSLTDQHMYISTNPTSPNNLGSLTINFNPNNPEIPPDGCLQYFTGTSGSFRSFNFGQLIRNTFYNTCFRQERDFCGINYSVSSLVNSDPFKIGTQDTSKTSVADCSNARLTIPSQISNTFCGDFLNNMSNEKLNGVISSTTFMLRHEVNNMDITGTGYNLNYVQTPC